MRVLRLIRDFKMRLFVEKSFIGAVDIWKRVLSRLQSIRIYVSPYRRNALAEQSHGRINSISPVSHVIILRRLLANSSNALASALRIPVPFTFCVPSAFSMHAVDTLQIIISSEAGTCISAESSFPSQCLTNYLRITVRPSSEFEILSFFVWIMSAELSAYKHWILSFRRSS